MRAGIAIDTWKLPIFKRHLKEAGYEYEFGERITSNTRMLYVETDDIKALHKVVWAANIEAKRI